VARVEAKGKERRVVGDGDDVILVEDVSSNNEDEESCNNDSSFGHDSAELGCRLCRWRS
jgi:hypothetical protein